MGVVIYDYYHAAQHRQLSDILSWNQRGIADYGTSKRQGEVLRTTQASGQSIHSSADGKDEGVAGSSQ